MHSKGTNLRVCPKLAEMSKIENQNTILVDSIHLHEMPDSFGAKYS